MGGDAGQMDPPGLQFDEGQHLQPSQPDRVDGEESQATIPAACWRRNAFQVVAARRGAGSRPWRRRVVRITVAETGTPRWSSSPWMRWWPRRGFSLARWTISCCTSWSSGGRPAWRCG
jgi:hypothetical protein